MPCRVVTLGRQVRHEPELARAAIQSAYDRAGTIQGAALLLDCSDKSLARYIGRLDMGIGRGAYGPRTQPTHGLRTPPKTPEDVGAIGFLPSCEDSVACDVCRMCVRCRLCRCRGAEMWFLVTAEVEGVGRVRWIGRSTEVFSACIAGRKALRKRYPAGLRLLRARPIAYRPGEPMEAADVISSGDAENNVGGPSIS